MVTWKILLFSCLRIDFDDISGQSVCFLSPVFSEYIFVTPPKSNMELPNGSLEDEFPC